MRIAKKAAFTLVELSVVLVVIGLLTGAILKGQEIIKSAKLKRIISDFSNISTAIYTYEDRYNKLPGDDGSSVIGKVVVSNGNEDGVIDAQESKFVLRHLRKAGIISGTPDDNQLGHAFGGNIVIIQGSHRGPGSMPEMAGTAICFENVESEDAGLIDSQNDDGSPKTGAIQADADYTSGKMVTICSEV